MKQNQTWSILFLFQFLFWTEQTSFEFSQISCWNNDSEACIEVAAVGSLEPDSTDKPDLAVQSFED